MTLTFFSNFLNHHQQPLCQELYNSLGDNFHFVASKKIPESFISGGYKDLSDEVYCVNYYENKESRDKALSLLVTSDVVIMGSSPPFFIKERMKGNKLTFRQAERELRKGPYQKFFPKTIRRLWLNHTRYRKRNLHMLCSSAYASRDLEWAFAYPGRKYKWGYFTKVASLNVEAVLKAKRQSKLRLLFVARLIPLKHPELLIEVAEALNAKKYDFEISVIGSGELEDQLKNTTKEKGLGQCIQFLGNLDNEVVLQEMQKHNVLLFTSDRNEGWGAVINEAMSNACTVIGSHEIGSIPYLIKHGETGLIFKSKSAKDLCTKIERLILDRELCEKMAFNAYHTISKIWAPRNAASNFLQLVKDLKAKREVTVKDGPCSIASPISESGFYKSSHNIPN